MRTQVSFKNAYFIKLGSGGKWEQPSFSDSIMRIGWSKNDIEDANLNDWKNIANRRQKLYPERKISTRDLGALRLIHDSTSDDIWITFSRGDLWWCKLAPGNILHDEESAYRQVVGQWSNQDVDGNRLMATDIPGDLSAIQGFRGTVCRVRNLDALRRVVNHESSPQHHDIEDSYVELIARVATGIKRLHWKDFETLVDLVFRASGWRRLSMLGETMKLADLELQDPITMDRYQVQVKSRATQQQFNYYANQFNPQTHRRNYFVVHTPDKDLAALQNNERQVTTELIRADRLSEMAVRLGLVEWLLNRVK